MKTITTTLYWYHYPEDKPKSERYKLYLVKHSSLTFKGDVSFAYKICLWDGEDFLYQGKPLYMENLEYLDLEEL